MVAPGRSVGRPPSFGRDDMLAAAVGLIDEGGLDACTLRAVAKAVGVTAMALYRQVESKDDLLDLIPDHLMASIGDELAEAIDGIDALRRMAAHLTTVLVAHPNASPLFRRPTMGSHMTSAAATVIDRLAADGYDRQRAAGLLRATVALVIGLADGGGQSAEEALGPVAADAVEVWLLGVAQSTLD